MNISIIDEVYSGFFQSKLSTAVTTLFLVLYAGMAKPKLPNPIKKLFENDIFRIIILSLIVYKGNKNTRLSLFIAIAFVISMNKINDNEINESFKNI